MAMRALVTGSAGFVGRHMVKELLDRGWDVALCDIAYKRTPKDALDLFREDDTVYDLVVHCAATAPYRSAIDGQPMNLIDDLLLDTAMFKWAVRTQQKHVVYMSSSAAYPVSLQKRGIRYQLHEANISLTQPELGDAAYGLTKLTGENMAEAVRKAGVKVTVVRPFSGYGEDQGENWPFGAFIGRALRKEDPFTVWGDGTQVRDWIHIDDVIGGILALVDAEVDVPVNLCTGLGTSMWELITKICDVTGHTPQIEAKLGAPEGVHYRVGNPTRLKQWYTPKVSLDEGIRRALQARGV